MPCYTTTITTFLINSSTDNLLPIYQVIIQKTLRKQENDGRKEKKETFDISTGAEAVGVLASLAFPLGAALVASRGRLFPLPFARCLLRFRALPHSNRSQATN